LIRVNGQKGRRGHAHPGLGYRESRGRGVSFSGQRARTCFFSSFSTALLSNFILLSSRFPPSPRAAPFSGRGPPSNQPKPDSWPGPAKTSRDAHFPNPGAPLFSRSLAFTASG
jgi:hypothetical protein